jgi:hypothetical protein
VAERLGRALQKLVQRFKSARDLWKSLFLLTGFFYLNEHIYFSGNARTAVPFLHDAVKQEMRLEYPKTQN